MDETETDGWISDESGGFNETVCSHQDICTVPKQSPLRIDEEKGRKRVTMWVEESRYFTHVRGASIKLYKRSK